MITEEAFADYRSSADYQDFIDGILDHAGTRVAAAQAALNDAEASRRVDAVIAVRAHYGKTAIANRLGISRPTLDAWVRAVEADPDELQRALEHEAFVKRELSTGGLSVKRLDNVQPTA